jgi:hypothetical protein
MKVDEFVKKMRSRARPGWPAVTMREISTLCGIIERQRMTLEVLSKEAPNLKYLNQFWCKIARDALEMTIIEKLDDLILQATEEKDVTIRESCVIIAEGIKVVEGLEEKIAALTADSEILRNMNKILSESVRAVGKERDRLREAGMAIMGSYVAASRP